MAETEMGGPGGRFATTLWTLVLQAKAGEDDQRLRALNELFARYGKPHLFEALKAFVSAGPDDPGAYAVVSAKLGLSEGAARVAVHRARRRYRDLIRAEVRHTLDVSEDVDAEVRHLFEAVR